MKALLLHGTSGSHESNWLPWLSERLEALNWKTWVPDLPMADYPDITRYTSFLLENLPWTLDEETVVVGHSSGSLAALGLLQSSPTTAKVRLCVLVGAFKDTLGWSNLDGLFTRPFDFASLRKRAAKFVLYHSDTDPYCPVEHAEFLAKELDGELRLEPGQGHFSAETEPPYLEFPKLLQLLETFGD
jgi:uncharacterized protein